jgi:hypothetical protein
MNGHPMTKAILDDRNAASTESPEEVSARTSPLLAYRELVNLAGAGTNRSGFPEFFAPRPSPMTLTLAR